MSVRIFAVKFESALTRSRLLMEGWDVINDGCAYCGKKPKVGTTLYAVERDDTTIPDGHLFPHLYCDQICGACCRRHFRPAAAVQTTLPVRGRQRKNTAGAES